MARAALEPDARCAVCKTGLKLNGAMGHGGVFRRSPRVARVTPPLTFEGTSELTRRPFHSNVHTCVRGNSPARGKALIHSRLRTVRLRIRVEGGTDSQVPAHRSGARVQGRATWIVG